jgi:hypothetical protein
LKKIKGSFESGFLAQQRTDDGEYREANYPVIYRRINSPMANRNTNFVVRNINGTSGERYAASGSRDVRRCWKRGDGKRVQREQPVVSRAAPGRTWWGDM